MEIKLNNKEVETIIEKMGKVIEKINHYTEEIRRIDHVGRSNS